MKKLTKSEEKQLTKEEYDKYYYWLRNKYDKSFLANLTPEQKKDTSNIAKYNKAKK